MPRKISSAQSYTNTKESKELCRKLFSITGIKPSSIVRMIKLANSASVHNIAEKALDSDSALSMATIEIPYIATIQVKYEDGDLIIEDTKFESSFKNDIIKAMTMGESPLLKLSEERMVDKLKSMYDQLY